MRINRETLLKIARNTVSQRSRTDRNLLAVYLHGSLLEEEYLLGAATDIDLFFIHADLPALPREIVQISDDIHLDIAHVYQRDYRNTRLLRIHPWSGPTLHECKILYDPRHFLDFTQASVRGQYEQPEFVLERSNQQAESARQNWLDLHAAHSAPNARDVLVYLKSLEKAANAIAGLNGHPLTERRFLLRFPTRCAAAGRPGLYPLLVQLLGSPELDIEMLRSWLPLWQEAYNALPPGEAPISLHPARLAYYRKGIEELLTSSQPLAALWPLLRTWTLAVTLQPEKSTHYEHWQASLSRLGLVGADFTQHLAGLDAFLDQVEEILEQWAAANGVNAA